jgi:hypothetical protein
LSNLQEERIESIKVGILAGFSFFLTYIVALFFNYFLLAKQWLITSSLNINSGITLALQLAIAFFTGFLFGVTYRYIIRTDKNPHLKDGAVLAFGLIRGLVFVEISDNILENIYPLLILIIESLLSFLITRLIVDFALIKKFIKPF